MDSIRKNIYGLIVAFMLLAVPSQILAIIDGGGGASSWTKMDITLYVHKDVHLTTSGVETYVRYGCTARASIGSATCPDVGYFNYSGFAKKADPTSTFPYYKYYITKDRGTSSLPARGWTLTFKRNPTATERRYDGSAKLEYSYDLPYLGQGTIATFDSNGIKYDTSPKNVTDPNTENDDTTADPTNTETSSVIQSGPLTVLFGKFDLSRTYSNQCPSGATTFSSGLLKGIPCEGAIDSPAEVLTFVRNIVTVLLLPLVGLLFIIMLIIGGILYITSRGNQTQLDRGKKTLTAAIIGLLIVTLSYTLIAIFASLIGGGTT